MRHGGPHVLPLQQEGKEDKFIDSKKNINLIFQFHPRKEIVAEPEEESKKMSYKGRKWSLKQRLKLQTNFFFNLRKDSMEMETVVGNVKYER